MQKQSLTYINTNTPASITNTSFSLIANCDLIPVLSHDVEEKLKSRCLLPSGRSHRIAYPVPKIHTERYTTTTVTPAIPSSAHVWDRHRLSQISCEFDTQANFIRSDICKIALAIILPPVGVLFERGIGSDFFINILLTILGYIPGIIHALYVAPVRCIFCAKHDQITHTDRLVRYIILKF